MAIYRVITRWTGFQGAPGYTNLHFTSIPTGGSAEDARDRVRAFFNEARTVLPTDVGLQVMGEVEVLDDETGMITGYETVAEDSEIASGVMGGGYSAASGAVITWMTAGVRNGRRVRGRTFLVPLGGDAYQNDGTLESTTISTLNDASQELVGEGFDSGFCIWSRPGVGGDGGVYPVTGFRVPDMSAVLRSRRD